MALKQMKVMRDHLNELFEGAIEERIFQQIEVGGLKKLLEDTQGSLKSMEEHISRLTNEVLVASVIHFQKARRRVAFLYPHLD